MIKKEFLIKEYVDNEKSMQQIANENNLAVGTIYNYMKKYGIESRKHLSSRAKRMISEKNKGKSSGMKGKKHSVEAREKISMSKKGKFKHKTDFGGHIKKRKDGYIYVYCPNHKNATKDGYVMEHHLVMENHIGRLLKKDEVVHHKNKKRDDNRIENLQLMTFKEHAKLHMLERHRERKMTYK